MNEVEVQLSSEELIAIHNLANDLGCTPDKAIAHIATRQLETGEFKVNSISDVYGQLSVIFDNLAKQAKEDSADNHLCMPCFLRKAVQLET